MQPHFSACTANSRYDPVIELGARTPKSPPRLDYCLVNLVDRNWVANHHSKQLLTWIATCYNRQLGVILAEYNPHFLTSAAAQSRCMIDYIA